MVSEKQIEAAAKAIYANAKNTDARDIARIALTAAEQAEPARVKVKALEWEETHSGGFKADSALGYYEISMGFGSDAYYWAVTNPLGDDVGSDFEDPSYAKAAAQADYERRILAALEPAEPATDEARLREALANLVQEIDDLVSESEGVAGLHLNGDVAEWDDLLPGGPYERLSSLNDARAALKEASE